MAVGKATFMHVSEWHQHAYVGPAPPLPQGIASQAPESKHWLEQGRGPV